MQLALNIQNLPIHPPSPVVACLSGSLISVIAELLARRELPCSPSVLFVLVDVTIPIRVTLNEPPAIRRESVGACANIGHLPVKSNPISEANTASGLDVTQLVRDIWKIKHFF